MIRCYGFDAETGALEIEFVSGAQYRDAGLPRTTLEAFESASSKGHFFDAHIREHFQPSACANPKSSP